MKFPESVRIRFLNNFKPLTYQKGIEWAMWRRFVKRFDDMSLRSELDQLAQEIIAAERGYYAKLNHVVIGANHPCSKLRLN